MAEKIELDYENPLFSEASVIELTMESLNDFYAETQNSYRQYELFFVLLNSLHKYLGQGKKEVAAKISFLLAYYLFIALTPIANLELALHYVEKAIELDSKAEYIKLKNSIEDDLRG